MRNRIDPKHSRAIIQEIGERLHTFLKEEELPGALQNANRPAPRIGRAVTINHSSG
jgi:hypothetical protein